MKGNIYRFLERLLIDLSSAAEPAQRLQRLVAQLRAYFECGAVAVLHIEDEHLCPLAIDGLVQETLGRRFSVIQHPRFSAIWGHEKITRFHHQNALPDPYDGLLLERVGESIPVHDCMGVSLYPAGEPWGVLTFDSLEIDAFTEDVQKNLYQLLPVITATIRFFQLETKIQTLQAKRQETLIPFIPDRVEENGLVGQSPPILMLLRELDAVADSELPVLLLGETGVGKELFAHRLHQLSRRKNKPLVHVNCAALPESLAESELFGHTRGAFSGAVTERAGRFDVADKGTLFLDEVGELPLPIQAKLLRTLQNGEIQRLGKDKPHHVDVRIIAATNRNLKDLVRDGAFRADLYHRLSVYPIPIPPLRERGDDILLLAGRFLEINRARLGVRSLRLSTMAQQALYHYAWPGNVRELEHVISRAAIKAISRGARHSDIVTLEADMLDLQPVSLAEGLANEKIIDTPGVLPATTLRQAVDASQRQAIEGALKKYNGNWAEAARQLDVDASNLHKLARRLGLK